MISSMALKHRKLFPSQTSTTNQTVSCSDFCPPPCSVDCYSYPYYSYFQPPSPKTSDHHNNRLYVIIIVSVILISLLFLVAYYLFFKIPRRNLFNWRNNRTANQSQLDDDVEFIENQVDHPIWFITTVGLQQRIINSITVCKYKKSEGLIEGTDCSVCLNEFREDETLRLLPKCNHAFHIPCIDTWLRSHTNCPLCRTLILGSDETSPLVSAERNFDSIIPIVDTQMENFGVNDGLCVNQGTENRTGTEEVSEIILVNDGTVPKESVNDFIEVDPDHNQKDDVQNLRRSVSVSSLFLESSIYNRCPNENEGSSINHVLEEEKKSRRGVSTRPMRSFSVARSLRKSPVRMKRSFSCSERFFASTRGLKSILPL